MYDGGKVIVGLLIFLILITFPVWYNVANGKATYRPDPVVQTANDPGRDTCILPAEEMKTKHMELLNTWRDEVVRQGKRWTTTGDGHHVEMSLNRTCMSCHPNKAQFCDQCHNYLDVNPYCWDCHVEPQAQPAPGEEGGAR